MYPTLKQLNWPQIEAEILAFWERESVFQQSIDQRSNASSFTFFEGPPSANGMPGIHHVMSRAIKDIFCRYKTQQGFRVGRKAGWDTHGLPIELQVEKRLGIKKEDIGTKISLEDFNRECRKDVLIFKDKWDELTKKIGYWVDLDEPYVTYENNYIESLWYLLKKLHEKRYLYKDFTIQPYSPAAGTGLSSHELNQPGTYQNVKDTSVVAQFKVLGTQNEYFLAWTTTPWTLPSNTALAVGKNIDYDQIDTYNPYTGKRIKVTLASALVKNYFNTEGAEANIDDYTVQQKILPWKKLGTRKGSELAGTRYEQLLPYAQPEEGDAFRVIIGDFVSTEDGTGIVHIAPSFGADDYKIARENGIGTLTLVDKEGKFLDCVTDFAGEYVKEAYLSEEEKTEETKKQGREKYLGVDERIAIKLKHENKAFKVEKYEHTYPHCWRTDKPILYYPLESWFIRTTAVKDRLIELNKTINWKPASTGEGRFGNWLENLVDWNLSRSRFWGTPLPIWRTEDGSEEICIGSIPELYQEIEKANAILGLKQSSYKENLDLHRPFVDQITLVSPNGKPMKRELDLIDVWFDSGAVPYAQWHYPFENEGVFETNFPADFIAEGVDQTRGWFFTMHALSTLLFDSVAFKNVIANGLILDKNGNKMSKRLGNAIDPFETVSKYGADAVRWYMVTNAQPWDNLKFDMEGVVESQRKFLGTLYNTYSFFAIYANLDNYVFDKHNPVEISHLKELDHWILSKLNSLQQEVETALNDFDPTRAGRAIEDFVGVQLSNWYVRLSRRRFWKGEMNADKQAAYETLYRCLNTLTQLCAPMIPFFADWLFRALNKTIIANGNSPKSVHLTDWPKFHSAEINKDLETSMSVAQTVCSLVLSLRKKEKIKVRQPLQKILLPADNSEVKEMITRMQSLICGEVNVKEIEFVSANHPSLIKRIKPNFKTLGKKLGQDMKAMASCIQSFSQEQIRSIENDGKISFALQGQETELLIEDVDISTQDMPGWLLAHENGTTVALDITITEDLHLEGMAREFVNRIQNLRKESGFALTDRIHIYYNGNELLTKSVNHFKSYICDEVLALSMQKTEKSLSHLIDVYENSVQVSLIKV
ncbi:MAG: isoleucine--tRNA ligase [Flavobacteriales bacterium]|nr:MAG: isoleucine--tRNA ligase [Flavobacteriales bacterium]